MISCSSIRDAGSQTLKVTIRDNQTQGQILTGNLEALSYNKTDGLIITLSSPSVPLKRGYIDGVPFDIYKIDILTKPK
jgi:hypothetical protein